MPDTFLIWESSFKNHSPVGKPFHCSKDKVQATQLPWSTSCLPFSSPSLRTSPLHHLRFNVEEEEFTYFHAYVTFFMLFLLWKMLFALIFWGKINFFLFSKTFLKCVLFSTTFLLMACPLMPRDCQHMAGLTPVSLGKPPDALVVLSIPIHVFTRPDPAWLVKSDGISAWEETADSGR